METHSFRDDGTAKAPDFQKSVVRIALPVTLQSLLQSSFSVVDQVMIGQLGSGSIAGIGLGGKFASLYSVVLAAVAAVAGIMAAQYMGKRDWQAVRRSFRENLLLALGLAAVFTALGALVPQSIMALYTSDAGTRAQASRYLRILSASFLPMAVTSILTVLLRCMEAAGLALGASVLALFANTGLNYLLIFGKLGFPQLGVAGAAWATVLSQLLSCAVIALLFAAVTGNRKYALRAVRNREDPSQSAEPDRPTPQTEESSSDGKRCNARKLRGVSSSASGDTSRAEYRRQYFGILWPMLICEFLWSLGENVYTAIYGNMGTDACAAVTMTIPVQTLVIGALSGLSQASGILIGKALGSGCPSEAYEEAKKLMKYGACGSVILSAALLLISPAYVRIYRVEPEVQMLTRNVLLAFALISPVKVQNMILGGGILRSGGKTRYVMWIDIIGTWLLGVPLGLLAAFVWKLPIAVVYLLLSSEECVRLAISVVLFRRKVWMDRLK